MGHFHIKLYGVKNTVKDIEPIRFKKRSEIVSKLFKGLAKQKPER